MPLQTGSETFADVLIIFLLNKVLLFNQYFFLKQLDFVLKSDYCRNVGPFKEFCNRGRGLSRRLQATPLLQTSLA